MEERNNDMSAQLIALRAQIAALSEELNSLRSEVMALKQSAAQCTAAAAPVSEEDVIAISAAVAAFLGVRARVRQVRLLHSNAWAQVGRIGTHASHHTH